MKCRKCQNRAVILMRQHTLALCKNHFLEWFIQQTGIVIRRQKMFSHGDKILVAVSGGKDSLALWDVLNRLGYQSEGLYIDLGIVGENSYSKMSQEFVESFAKDNGYLLHILDTAHSYGESIPSIYNRSKRGRGKPCSVCGVVKRYVLNRYARENGFSVLATGHNLDDEAAVLLGNMLSWSLDMLQRQNPVLREIPGFCRKVKPLYRFYERETAAYAILQGISYIEDECPHAAGNKAFLYKDSLNRLESSSPGTKMNFFTQFMKVQERGGLSAASLEDSGSMMPCPVCEQPTSTGGLCVFCRLFAS